MSVKVGWIDATFGAAGDMLLGALLDAGGDERAVREALVGLARAGSEPIELGVEATRRHGLRASRALVTCPASDVARRLGDVRGLIAGAGMAPAAQAFAERVFQLLATAEARVHGVGLDAVHFHEVGALDSLADVVGCAVALDSLGLLAGDSTVTVSSVGVGAGTVTTEHGILPVPVPAVLEILAAAAAPMHSGPAVFESCTPTGAALLATLAGSWGSSPEMSLVAVGVGAGGHDPIGHPNVVRIALGSAHEAAAAVEQDVVCVESTVDDLDPRLWPLVLDALHAAGALDAWLTPVVMRHGRPGHVVTALARPTVVDAVFDCLVQETSTLGARLSPVTRRSLSRDVITVVVAGEAVSVKRGLGPDGVRTVQPEFDDAVRAAQRSGRAVAEILTLARAAAVDHTRRS